MYNPDGFQICYMFSAAVYLHETIFKLISFSLFMAADKFWLFDLCTALKNIMKPSIWTELVVAGVQWKALGGEVMMLLFESRVQALPFELGGIE